MTIDPGPQQYATLNSSRGKPEKQRLNHHGVPSTTDAPGKHAGSSPLRHLWRALRPKQWVKNVFVFSAIVFAKENLLLDTNAVGTIVIAFLLFCFISSAVYLINDLADIEKDRQHPEKRYRPLPSGALTPGMARGEVAILLLICIGVIGYHVWVSPAPGMGWGWFGLVGLLYFLLQLTYTFGLKHVVLLDVFAIAAGFVLRAVAGAVIISVEITAWWILCVFFLALFMALGKRRSELHA